ncbi:MAG: hypothetical protein OEV44_00255 [Spirochaetota bacterium]|nr:hypothetical protein [Spirochaetota bacterium]
MDITKEYIEKCKKAQDIQKLRVNGYEWGDYYFYFNDYDICIENPRNFTEISTSKEITRLIIGRDNHIWLPCQDQLQNMLKTLEWFWSDKNASEMLDSVYYMFTCCTNDNGFNCTEYCNKFNSFEQLWLAFVMKEKYNKQWNFETKEWEKI